MIKLIQRGTITFTFNTGSSDTDQINQSATATITSVDTTKAHLVAPGALYTSVGNGTFGAAELQFRLELTNATTVTARITTHLPAFSGGSVTIVVGFEVVEFL